MKNYTKVLLPLLYFGVISIIGMGFILMLSGVKNTIKVNPSYKYTLDNVFTSDVMNVVSEVNDSFVKPYITENIELKRYFYNKDDDMKKQENEILYYENTYIQNKGSDYTSSEAFDIVSVCDGEVTSVEENEIYGTVVTVRNSENLEVIYSNLTNVLVSVGNRVSQGELFATSNKSKFDKGLYMLHFEVKHAGKHIDPESIYSVNISTLK